MGSTRLQSRIHAAGADVDDTVITVRYAPISLVLGC
jgi:hypothetical protein